MCPCNSSISRQKAVKIKVSMALHSHTFGAGVWDSAVAFIW